MRAHQLTRCLLWMLFAVSTITAFAQPPDSLWSRTWGGTGDDQCISVMQTADGGYVLAGTTCPTPCPGWYCQFWLVKTDSNGDSVWSRVFGGPSDEGCNALVQTSDGGYALVGYTYSFGAGYSDSWLVKTDANGDSLWSRTFGGMNNDGCSSVQQTSDGGYVLAGWTVSFGAGSSDFWLVKTDANGDSLWSRTFGGPYDESCYSVKQTSDGGYVLAGATSSIGEGWDFWLVKTDSIGDSLWSRNFGGEGAEWCFAVQQTSDGGYILAGLTTSFGTGFDDFWLLKTNANGDSLWSHCFGGMGAEDCYSLCQTSDSGYVLAGRTSSFGEVGDNFWLVKTNANGDSLWSRTFGGTFGDECHSVQQTSDGGYVLAGNTCSFGAVAFDFWLVKTGPGLAVEPAIVSMPAQYALYPNWPNPFNPSTRIAYDITKISNVTLTVFDLLGRKVATLANGVQAAGTRSVTFDGADLPSGIYFYRLQTGDFTTTRKMVLLK